MKELIKRSCGHEETIKVFGPNEERRRIITRLESTPCEDCYYAEKGYEKKEMLYKEYKQEYENKKEMEGLYVKKDDSYNRETKTVIVYVTTNRPTEVALEEAPKTLEEKLLAIGIPEKHVAKYAALSSNEATGMYIRYEKSFNGNIGPHLRKDLDTIKKAVEIIKEEKEND